MVWRRLSAALLASSLLPLNSTMIAVALPEIAREFAVPAGTVTQTLVASYLVAAIVLQSPGGKVGDRIGHRRVLALGQVVMAAGAALGYLAPGLGVLALARVLIAAGGAVVVPATVALLRSELPPHRRGRGFGAFGAVMSLAAAVGPVVGGELVSRFGWQSVFVVNLPVLGVCAVLAVAVRHPRVPAGPPAASPRPRFDWPGTLLLAGLLSSFVLGLQSSGIARVVLLGCCVTLVVPFVWWQRRADDPIVAFSLFRSLPFAAGTTLIAVQNLTMYTLLFELPQVLHALIALDSASTGRLLVFMMAAMVATSLVAGRLVDRFGPRPLAVAGSLCCLAGLGVLAAVDLSSVGAARLPMVLLGIGLGLTAPAAQSSSLEAIDRRDAGMAAGVNSTMRYLGGVVGVGLLGRLLDVDGGHAEILAEHRVMLGVFGAALLVGLVCSVLLPRADRRTSVPPGAVVTPMTGSGQRGR